MSIIGVPITPVTVTPGILFATATELITEALYELGVFAPGDSIPAENIQSGLKRLNMLFDSWSIERQLIFSRAIDVLTLTAGKASYTIGSAGDFDTVRPTRIEQANITIDSIDYPLSCVMMEDEYTGIPDKTTETRPARLYYKGTYPLGTIYFDCEPDQAYALTLYSAKPFTKFATSEDAIQYPDGYETAIMYNLAVLLAPSYGKRPSDVTLAMAQQTRQNIKRQNHEPIRQNYSGLPGSGGDEYDIITRSFAS